MPGHLHTKRAVPPAGPAPLVGEAAARLARRAAAAAVLVAGILVAAKLAGYLVTGSVALLGSLVDSLLDVSASLINLLAVRHASQPADRQHRFGHGKAEAIAGLAQAALIGGSAVFLFWESIHRLIEPVEIEHGLVGLALILGALVMTLALVTYQRSVVRRTGSIAIGADALHYRSDIIMNASVLVALVLAGEFGFARADSAFGLAIAAYVAWSAWRILVRAFDHLMDSELPDAERTRIKAIVAAEPDVRAMHDLRTRRSGFNIFIQLHLEMDPDFTLERAHGVSDRVEARIKAAFPGAEVIIHEDPAGRETPHSFSPVKATPA